MDLMVGSICGLDIDDTRVVGGKRYTKGGGVGKKINEGGALVGNKNNHIYFSASLL
jgi:hypothetical protein